ncbi:hypothetical protein DCAR_0520261 [Daucus carota subsp. sativus]|uniref:Uncharacterized protein n=1 Tax=Daucus carota subsp. sativus TaxID=79200 RepID=A0A164YBX7_DAUCS|nr:hypothetical protein DCAR_0520261 [Daucus carota subsp. sativus]
MMTGNLHLESMIFSLSSLYGGKGQFVKNTIRRNWVKESSYVLLDKASSPFLRKMNLIQISCTSVAYGK